jgi:hypothetical protein
MAARRAEARRLLAAEFAGDESTLARVDAVLLAALPARQRARIRTTRNATSAGPSGSM